MIPRSVRIDVEGMSLAADEWGDPADPGVVMLHGAGQSRRAWKHCARVMSEHGWFVLTVDARGHGESEWSAEADYAIETMAADLLHVLDRFGGRPAVVGASMGGMTSLAAQQLAHVDEQLFSAVVLVDITPNFDLAGAKRVLAFMGGNHDGFATLDEAAEVIAAYNPHRARPTDTTRLVSVLRKRDDGRWVWRWDPAYISSRVGMTLDDDEAMLDHMESTREVMYAGAHAVTVPRLLVRGGQSDLVTPEAVAEFLREVPGCEFVDVAGTGHMVAGDDNDSFTAAVVDFLARHHPPTARISPS